MKKLVFLLFMAGFCAASHAQVAPSDSAKTAAPAVKKVTAVAEPEFPLQEFKVAGNCGMCRDRIEKTALSVAGVQYAQWNDETQALSVRFDDKKTTLDEIRKKVAASGHDTDLFGAPDKVYKKLPGCCQYDRLTYKKGNAN